MAKNHKESFARFFLKKIAKLLPPSLPAKIYRFIASIPLLKQVTNAIIRSIIPRSIKVNEGEILLNQKDVAVSGSLALGIFEKEELLIFRNSIKNGMTVVDLGANIGLYTVIAAKRVGLSGKVFSYEPEEENFNLLSRNIELNSLKNATPIKTALSDSKGERTLYFSKDNRGTHSFSDYSHLNQKISVETDTLDHSIEKYGSPKIDIIKMDIEGAEPLALEGMKSTIKNNPDMVMFVEIYPRGIKRLNKDPLQFLKSLGNFGFFVWIIHEDKEELEKLDANDFEKFIEKFPAGEVVKNLYVSKKPYAAPSL